jgi:carbon storage regulator
MIVLSRKKNESIRVDAPASAEVTITVVEVRDDKVRLGIQAPKEVSVCRTELYQAFTDKDPDYSSIIGRLRDELNKSRTQTSHYRNLLSKLAMEPWQDVTPEQLVRETNEGGDIEDVLTRLELAASR